MKTKYISALITFVVTFGLSVTVASFLGATPASNADRIYQLLAEDINNGAFRDQNYRGCRKRLAEHVNEYVDRSEGIKTDDLPTDFRRAWQRHMHAWRNQSDFLNANHQRTEEFQRIYYQNNSEIERTWDEVLSLATVHGSQIPPGAR